MLLLYLSQKDNAKKIRKYPTWYYDYKTMNYKEWLFKWEYQVYANTYDIEHIRPVCSCECELVEKHKVGNVYYGDYVLFCPNCQKVYKSPDIEIIDEVKRLISYNINKKQNA